MRVANPGGETRYFVLFGSFAFPESEKTIGAIAIDSNGTLYRAWPERVKGGEYLGPHIGLAIAPDGTIATNAKGILNAQSWCGRPLWQAAWSKPEDGIHRDFDSLGGYDWHHDIVYHDGSFWTFQGPRIAQVDARSGEVQSSIHAIDLIRWSWAQGLSLMDGGIGLFNANRLNEETAEELIPGDPFHFNKVDVLSEALAPLYPGLEAGDLLISVRNLDLIAIVRPSQHRFLWWRHGLTSRAHDATFVDGAIEVFDNAPFTNPPAPRIRRLDYQRTGFEEVFDLSSLGFVTRQQGNFEHRGDELLTVDGEAGRAILTRLDGTIEFLFENGHDDGKDVALIELRNATEIAPDTFARLQEGCS